MTPYQSHTDLELVSLIKANNRFAFDELYRRQWKALYQSAKCALNDHDGSIDIVQDVFVWFWEHREALEIASVKGYLMAAVKYKVANYIRSGKVKDSFFQHVESLDVRCTPADSSLELKELQHIINMFTKSLPSKCKEIFLLSREGHLSNKEIALKLGISEKTVENQMTIALKKLRFTLHRLTSWLIFSFFVILSLIA